MNIDDRGSFTEFLKTKEYSQVSVNISKQGITKGNYWHHTKYEKFLVVSGIGLIQFRKIGDDKIINLGKTDMVTIIWANEMFDPNKPDTYFEKGG